MHRLAAATRVLRRLSLRQHAASGARPLATCPLFAARSAHSPLLHRRPCLSARSWSAAASGGRLPEPVEEDAGALLHEESFDITGEDDLDEDELPEDADALEDDDEDEEGEEEAEDYDPTCTTGGVPWGESALRVAQEVLAQPPFAGVLELYSFRVHASEGRLVARLDKPGSSFGSPSLDELGAFSTAYDAALDGAKLQPDTLTVEVSSAGAER